MQTRLKNLWQNRDFLKLWSAQTTSAFGTQIASLAYPLTAILVLQASAFEMGIVRASGSASAFIAGFFVGVIADRVSRKPLLIFADLGRAFLAALIPVAAFSGFLRIEHLYVIAFFAGVLTAGLLGDLIGLRAVLFIGACGMFLPFLRLFFSTVRNLKQQFE